MKYSYLPSQLVTQLYHRINIPVSEVEIGDFDKVFLTNAKGMLLCSKEAIESMSANNIVGHIININR